MRSARAAGLATIFVTATAFADAAPSYRAAAESFMQVVDAGNGAGAVDWIYGHSPGLGELGRSRPERVVELRSSFQGLLSGAGQLRGHVLVAERNLGDRFVQLDFLVVGEKRPLHVGVTFYRPGAEWSVWSWTWDANPERLINAPQCPVK